MHQWGQSLPKTQRSFGAKEFQSWTKWSLSDQFFAKNTKELGHGDQVSGKTLDQDFCPKCIAQWTKMFMCVCLCDRYQINGCFCAILSSFWFLKSPFFVCETFKIRKRESHWGPGRFRILINVHLISIQNGKLELSENMESCPQCKFGNHFRENNREFEVAQNQFPHDLELLQYRTSNLNRLPNGLTAVHWSESGNTACWNIIFSNLHSVTFRWYRQIPDSIREIPLEYSDYPNQMRASETDHGNQHEMAFGNRAVTKNRLSIGETTGSTWKISKTKSKKIRVHEKKLIKLILSGEHFFSCKKVFSH